MTKAPKERLFKDVLLWFKRGFAVQLVHWSRRFLRERVHESLRQVAMLDGNWFDFDETRDIGYPHQSGVCDRSDPIWSLLMFEALPAQPFTLVPRGAGCGCLQVRLHFKGCP